MTQSRSEIEKLQIELSKVSQDQQTAQELVEKNREENERLRQKIIKAEREAEESYEQLNSTAEQMQKAAKSLVEVRKENKELHARIEEMIAAPEDSREAEALKTKINGMQATIDKLETELADTAQHSSSQMHDASQKYKEEISGLKSSLESEQAALQEMRIQLDNFQKKSEATESRYQELDSKYQEETRLLKEKLEQQTSSGSSLEQKAHNIEKERDQAFARLEKAEAEIQSLMSRLNETEKAGDTAASLEARVEGLEVEREELLRQNSEVLSKNEQLRKDLNQAEERSKSLPELAQLREENQALKDELSEAKAKEMNEEGLNLMEEIGELEKRKASLNRDLAQAKTTIMDAASFMGKMKAKDDKIDALSQEVMKWKTLAGIPDVAEAEAGSTHSQANALAAAAKISKGPSENARSFGRNVTHLKTNKDSNKSPASSQLRQKSTTSTKVLPKGDSRSKFAKSLFGNVKDKKTSK